MRVRRTDTPTTIASDGPPPPLWCEGGLCAALILSALFKGGGPAQPVVGSMNESKGRQYGKGNGLLYGF